MLQIQSIIETLMQNLYSSFKDQRDLHSKQVHDPFKQFLMEIDDEKNI